MAMFSCNKNPGSNFRGIDTIKYEAIFNYGNGNWCVAVTYPTYFGTDTSVIPTLLTTGYGQCYLTQNVEDTFIVKKYADNYQYLRIFAYNADPNASATFPDSAITLNIYINRNIVATQTGKTTDSVKYIIKN
jgi:hypothetical protein